MSIYGNNRPLHPKTRNWLIGVSLSAVLLILCPIILAMIRGESFIVNIVNFIIYSGLIFLGNAVLAASIIDYRFGFKLLTNGYNGNDLNRLNDYWGTSIAMFFTALLIAIGLTVFEKNAVNYRTLVHILILICGVGICVIDLILAYKLKKSLFLIEEAIEDSDVNMVLRDLEREDLEREDLERED